MVWERELTWLKLILFVEVAKTLECKGLIISLMDENSKLSEHDGRNIIKEESKSV